MNKKLVRKGLLLGLGAATIASEIVNAYVKGLVKEHKITAKEGKRLVKKLVGKTKGLPKSVAKLATKQVKGKISAGIRQTRQGLKLLEKSLDLLEKNIRKLK